MKDIFKFSLLLLPLMHTSTSLAEKARPDIYPKGLRKDIIRITRFANTKRDLCLQIGDKRPVNMYLRKRTKKGEE